MRIAQCIFASALVYLGALDLPAGTAQTPLLEALPPQFQEDYRAVLAEPGNLDRAYQLARRAETEALRGGEHAGLLMRVALSLYERMLLINPGLTQIRLRLGEINYRLGRFVTARAYFSQALQDPALPAPERANVTAFLEDTEARLSRHRLVGSLLVGVRHQSNATAAPPHQILVIEGAEVVIEDEFAPRSDQDVFGSLDLLHRYDLHTQRGDLIETQFSAYGAKQIEENDLDIVFLDATSGLRTPLGWPDASARPHGIARVIWFGGELFQVDVGGGIELSQQFGDAAIAGLELQAVQQFHPDDAELDGPELSGALALRHRPLDRLELGVRLIARWDDAKRSARTNLRYGGTLSGRVFYPAPFGLGARDWSSALSATWTETHFEGADITAPAGAPDREDQRYRLRGTTTVPIARDWSLVGAAGYTRNDSNVGVREFENWEFSFGVAYAF